MTAGSEFDRYAETYDKRLDRALSITGEDKQYFASRRVAFLAQSLRGLGFSPTSAIDYGCGTGDTVALLHERLRLKSTLGLEISEESLKIARAVHASPGIQFTRLEEYVPDGASDLVYCNGVFHHIAAAERPLALHYILDCLRTGGIFAFWENNPLNPGTRFVMSQCEFDHDAVPISYGSARRMLAASGFQVVSVKFLFFFPKLLKYFRALEQYLTSVPLGGQYLVLCRKV